MKKKRVRKTIKSDESFINYLWCIVYVVLSIIAFLHERTGFLGTFLFQLSRLIFGFFWPVPFIILVAYSVIRIIKKSIPKKICITLVLLLVAGLLIASCTSISRNVKGMETISQFFKNLKDVYHGEIIYNGGMLGTVLYGMISAAADFGGVIIVVAVLIIASILIYYPEIKKALDDDKNYRKPEKNLFDTEKKSFKLFDSISRKNDKQDKTPKQKKKIVIDDEPEPVKPQPVKKFDEKPAIAPVINESSVDNKKEYTLPSLNCLVNPVVPKKDVNKRNAAEKWDQLSDILESFGLDSSLDGYNIGPSVTQFEIVPNGNFNIRKYSSIEENIKMGLAVKDVRIEAPIPGKRAVGIEIPNEEPTMVRLKELLKDVPDKYQHEPLLIAVGKDLSGKGVYGLINKMPHMLIAGATGSGKSVCINSIISTLLLRTRPDEVKMLLIDPKKVEFAAYSNIPHLICPVINDTDKAAGALKKLIDIMEDRYNIFQQAGVKNISEYNNKNPNKRMYNIVCIIDELADLMATHGKDVEGYIHRLASLARASGIFMILATQRPSTDVITGTIKANIVSRIAFAVSSSYDSRTILDSTGAESLLGNGDMLYAPYGSSTPTRVQGVYISDDEIDNIVNHFAKNGYTPNFNDIFIVDDEEDGGLFGSADISDPLYKDIEKWVMTQKTISASGLQRRYSLGFPRAAKIIDALEQNGVISCSNGSKPRDVLMHTEENEE